MNYSLSSSLVCEWWGSSRCAVALCAFLHDYITSKCQENVAAIPVTGGAAAAAYFQKTVWHAVAYVCLF